MRAMEGEFFNSIQFIQKHMTEVPRVLYVILKKVSIKYNLSYFLREYDDIAVLREYDDIAVLHFIGRLFQILQPVVFIDW